MENARRARHPLATDTLFPHIFCVRQCGRLQVKLKTSKTFEKVTSGKLARVSLLGKKLMFERGISKRQEKFFGPTPAVAYAAAADLRTAQKVHGTPAPPYS